MLTMMDTLHDFWFLTILTYLANAENFGQVWHFLKMLDNCGKKIKKILTTFDNFCLQMLIIFAIFLSSIHDNFSYRSPTWFSTKFVQILVNPSDFHQFWWHFCRIFCGFIEIFTVFGDWFSPNFAAIFQSIYVHQFWWFFSWIFWWIIDNFTGIGELFITSTVTCLPD